MTTYFGKDKPCFVIAEIGANHNGDLDLCLKTIDAAKETGADAVKLQYYTAADLVADVDRVWAWGPEGHQVEERVGDMFDRLGLSLEELAKAYEHAASLKMPLFCTPFSVAGVYELATLGNPIYKIASSDVSFYPMLDAIAQQRKPVILSTGKSPIEDVRDAVAHFAALPAEDVALLHCVATYPAPLEQMNIRVVAAFQREFENHPVGLSDHCLADEPALASVALGGCIVEKHFTLGKDLYGPDHWFSLDPKDMTRLVSKIRDIQASLGDGNKRVEPCEAWEATYSRRSIIVMRDIDAGQTIEASDLRMLRPGTGIHPRHFDQVVGRVAKVRIEAREPLTWESLRDEAK